MKCGMIFLPCGLHSVSDVYGLHGDCHSCMFMFFQRQSNQQIKYFCLYYVTIYHVLYHWHGMIIPWCFGRRPYHILTLVVLLESFTCCRLVLGSCFAFLQCVLCICWVVHLLICHWWGGWRNCLLCWRWSCPWWCVGLVLVVWGSGCVTVLGCSGRSCWIGSWGPVGGSSWNGGASVVTGAGWGTGARVSWLIGHCQVGGTCITSLLACLSSCLPCV